MKALEFFSGIGAFAQAARQFDIDVVAAFDQNVEANKVYEFNYGLKPNSRNLDSISIDHLPQADLWWMSPPCTPFSVRGKQKDDLDPRARCFLNLIELAGVAQPSSLLIENVAGFALSRVKARLVQNLTRVGYQLSSVDLCPTMFGIPMRRPRHFVVAQKGGELVEFDLQQQSEIQSVRNFLFDDSAELYLDEQTLARYIDGFDLVEPDSDTAVLTCFTKSYQRCMKASGSLLRTSTGVRRFSPGEILRLLGFGDKYKFPENTPLELRWRMVGNSVDVRAIEYLLRAVVPGRQTTLRAAGDGRQ